MPDVMDLETDDAGVARVAEIPGGVLVGRDGSEHAQEALQWAGRLAARAGYPLHVLRAWKMTTAPQPATLEAGYVPPLEDFEKAVLQELQAHVAAAGLDLALSVTCHVAHGTPARGLIESAARADLLVVGARGRGGFAGLVLGSVSDQCVRQPPVRSPSSGPGRRCTRPQDAARAEQTPGVTGTREPRQGRHPACWCAPCVAEVLPLYQERRYCKSALPAATSDKIT